VSALFGYLVGLFVALQSFLLGRSIAYAISRRLNPSLAEEADVISDQKEIGILVNTDLPDFERRYLYDIVLEDEVDVEGLPAGQQNEPPLQAYGKDVYQNHFEHHIQHLKAWKQSTDGHRHVSPSYVAALQVIETNILLNREEPRDDLLLMARDAGWNIRALREWTVAMYEHDKDITQEFAWNIDGPSATEVSLTVFTFLLLTALLIWGFLFYDGTDPVSRNYRNQFLSALFSPFGTFLRWYLSRLNGSIESGRFEWLPVGTFLANMIAVVISALMQALMHVVNSDMYLALSFFEAIKVGFAGSLSTVSTFAAETDGLLKALPRYFWGYYYSFGSLVLGLILGLLSYGWSVS
jgi:fluoride ion exporter CrcB/FEX